ncbi:MAG: zinc ribbon domain-containing protein [Bacilli bacterium]|nr:zinc ribbon domain-containing protein [Bacilli bacterium]
MGFLEIVLIIVLSIVALLIFIALAVYFKIKIMLKKAGFNGNILNEIKKSSNELKNSEKSISGMTRLLEPSIIRDFKEFNKEELYTRTEKNLRTIFSALENSSMDGFSDMPLLYDIVKKEIEDYNNDHIQVEYNDIVFNNFAIKSYKKEQAEAIIEIAVSLRYTYKKYQDGRLVKSKDNYQTRYIVKFIYIIDEELFTKSKKVYGITCPNCGAAIKTLGDKNCAYCGAVIKDINLKAWFMSSYNEY